MNGVQFPAADADRVGSMALWAWIVMGSATLLALSLLVGLALAAILGTISSEVSELLELEPWRTAPPTRATAAAARS
jgi:ABC-type enterochelin transport system permease subunit